MTTHTTKLPLYLFTLLTISLLTSPTLAQICGENGKEGNEECDDDNKISGDGCSYPGCKVEDNWHCTLITSPLKGYEISTCTSCSLTCRIFEQWYFYFPGGGLALGALLYLIYKCRLFYKAKALQKKIKNIESQFDITAPYSFTGRKVEIKLGEGGSAYLIQNNEKDPPRELALKRCNLAIVGDNAQLAMAEAIQLTHIRHKHIIECEKYNLQLLKDKKEGQTLMNDELHLYVEHIEGESLVHHIKELQKEKKRLSHGLILRWFKQLVQAIKYCHEEMVNEDQRPSPLVHRDLKPNNILVTDDPDNPEGPKILMVGDFGIAMDMNNTVSLTQTQHTKQQQVITTQYQSPEQLIGLTDAKGRKVIKLPKSVDNWALGVILYELCTMTMLFNGNAQEMFTNITNGNYDTSFGGQPVPEIFQTMIEQLLQVNPDHRWNIMNVDDWIIQEEEGANLALNLKDPASWYLENQDDHKFEYQTNKPIESTGVVLQNQV